jgi:hypothetical protein
VLGLPLSGLFACKPDEHAKKPEPQDMRSDTQQVTEVAGSPACPTHQAAVQLNITPGGFAPPVGCLRPGGTATITNRWCSTPITITIVDRAGNSIPCQPQPVARNQSCTATAPTSPVPATYTITAEGDDTSCPELDRGTRTGTLEVSTDPSK